MDTSPSKAPPTESTPPDQMIPMDPIDRTPPLNANRQIARPQEPVMPEDVRPYRDNYETPPDQMIPMDPIDRTPPLNANRPIARPQEPVVRPDGPDRAVSEDSRPYQDNYEIPPDQIIPMDTTLSPNDVRPDDLNRTIPEDGSLYQDDYETPSDKIRPINTIGRTPPPNANRPSELIVRSEVPIIRSNESSASSNESSASSNESHANERSNVSLPPALLSLLPNNPNASILENIDAMIAADVTEDQFMQMLMFRHRDEMDEVHILIHDQTGGNPNIEEQRNNDGASNQVIISEAPAAVSDPHPVIIVENTEVQRTEAATYSGIRPFPAPRNNKNIISYFPASGSSRHRHSGGNSQVQQNEEVAAAHYLPQPQVARRNPNRNNLGYSPGMRIEELAAALGYTSEAQNITKKNGGGRGKGKKVNKSTQTIPDTSRVENTWIHEARRRADHLCDEISNLINQLYHVPGSPTNQRQPIPKTPQKKNARRSSADETIHETEKGKRKAAEHRFFVELNQIVSRIAKDAHTLQRAIPLPLTEEEQSLPTPESPPLMPPVPLVAGPSVSAPPLEQDVNNILAEDNGMCASGFQKDTIKDLAKMALEEPVDTWRNRDDLSPSSRKKITKRNRKTPPKDGRTPEQRSPFSHKSPPSSSSKSPTKRSKSAQKATIKDSGQQLCAGATEVPEPMNTGKFGARPKICSTSVWSKGPIKASTPHGGKLSKGPVVISASKQSKQSLVFSDKSAPSFGSSPSQVSSVQGPVTKAAFRKAISQAMTSSKVKASTFVAKSASVKEIRSVGRGASKISSSKASSATSGSGAYKALKTLPEEQSQSTKPSGRTKPVSQTLDCVGKSKASQDSKFISKEIRGVLCVLKGSSVTLQVSSSSDKGTRGAASVPKDVTALSKNQKPKVITHSRPIKNDKDKEISYQFTKFHSKSGTGNSRSISVGVRAATTLGRETKGATLGAEEKSSTHAAKKVATHVKKGTMLARLPNDDAVTKFPKGGSATKAAKGSSTIRTLQRRLSDQAANADMITGRTTASDASDMSLEILSPSLPLLNSNQTPSTLSRQVSDLTDKKQPTEKKP